MDSNKILNIMLDMAYAAKSASVSIMEIYNGGYDVSIKDDMSPVTDADLRSNEIITRYLRERYPECSVLSEEDKDSMDRLQNPAGVFIIDPLDGTGEFISKSGDFCVSIGFAIGHELFAGVIAHPVSETLYCASRGLGTYKTTFNEVSGREWLNLAERLHVSRRAGRSEGELLKITVSRSNNDEETNRTIEKNRHRIGEIVTVGSCLKGCYIAEGRADIHYRFAPYTKEWDTAAMQIICEEAGAIFTDVHGCPMSSNREDVVNRRGYRILNSPESALEL